MKVGEMAHWVEPLSTKANDLVDRTPRVALWLLYDHVNTLTLSE